MKSCGKTLALGTLLIGLVCYASGPGAPRAWAADQLLTSYGELKPRTLLAH